MNSLKEYDNDQTASLSFPHRVGMTHDFFNKGLEGSCLMNLTKQEDEPDFKNHKRNYLM